MTIKQRKIELKRKYAGLTPTTSLKREFKSNSQLPLEEIQRLDRERWNKFYKTWKGE